MLDLKSNSSGEAKYDFSNEVQLEFWLELSSEKKSAAKDKLAELNKSQQSNQSSKSTETINSVQFQESAQSIKSLNKHDLLDQVRQAAKTEQSLTLQVIELIAEILRRKVFLDFGYGSIFDFVTQDLEYEPSSAMRRIQAARAILEIPELKAKIADHSLSLTVVSQAQSYLRKKANDQRQKISLEEKTELYKSLENKSAKEAEKELFKLSPELCLKSREQEKVLSENLTELRFVIDSETKAKADELKLWLSHQNPDMTQAQFYKVMAEKLHRQLNPNKPTKLRRNSERTKNKSEANLDKKSHPTVENKFKSPLQNQTEKPPVNNSESILENKSEGASQTKPRNPQIDFNQSITAAGISIAGGGNADAKNADTNNADTNNAIADQDPRNIDASTFEAKPTKKRQRHIPTAIKNLVWQRDESCCQFTDPKTQKKCGSKYQVQLDHIHPFRHLGDSCAENLRLLCGKHNRWRD